MGIKQLWDTNIAIYYLQQQFPAPVEKIVDDLLRDSDLSISAITEIELLCWKTASEKDNKIVNDFIAETTVIELDRSIKLKTADIRKTHNIKLPDAIIAATAIVNDLTLISRNTKDFKDIFELKLINPYSL